MNWLGFGLCHQLPERSFFGGGVQVPVCARDTGIYLGFVISLALLGYLHRGARPRGLPNRPGWTVIGAFIAVMAWDGITSYAGLRETTNELRLFTGTATGFALAAVVLPMLNDVLWKYPGVDRVLTPLRALVIWAVSMPVAVIAIGAVGPRLGVGYPLLVAAAILATLTAINMVILGMLPFFDRKAETPGDLIGVAVAGLVLAFLEAYLAGRLNAALLALADRVS